MKIILSLLSLLLTAQLQAGSATNVKINRVVTQQANNAGTDRVCVYVSGNISQGPACSTHGRFCADITTPFGVAILSTALTAYATKADVTVDGTGTCANASNSEDLNYILLLD